MSELFTLEKRLQHVDEALSYMQTNHGPTGLIEVASDTTLNQLADIRMSPNRYAGVVAYCGLTEPPKNPKGKLEPMYAPHSLEDLEGYIGKVNPFALTGEVLAMGILKAVYKQGNCEEADQVKYVSGNTVRYMDSALAGGCALMGSALEKIARELNTTPSTLDEYQRVARNSLVSIPMAFARMSNADNRKREFLYGLRSSGTYGSQDAAYELGVDDPSQFTFVYDPNQDRVVPANWDMLPETSPEHTCPATRTRVFSALWRHMIEATTNMPELFEPKSAPISPDLQVV